MESTKTLDKIFLQLGTISTIMRFFGSARESFPSIRLICKDIHEFMEQNWEAIMFPFGKIERKDLDGSCYFSRDLSFFDYRLSEFLLNPHPFYKYRRVLCYRLALEITNDKEIEHLKEFFLKCSKEVEFNRITFHGENISYECLSDLYELLGSHNVDLSGGKIDFLRMKKPWPKPNPKALFRPEKYWNPIYLFGDKPLELDLEYDCEFNSLNYCNIKVSALKLKNPGRQMGAKVIFDEQTDSLKTLYTLLVFNPKLKLSVTELSLIYPFRQQCIGKQKNPSGLLSLSFYKLRETFYDLKSFKFKSEFLDSDILQAFSLNNSTQVEYECSETSSPPNITFENVGIYSERHGESFYFVAEKLMLYIPLCCNRMFKLNEQFIYLLFPDYFKIIGPSQYSNQNLTEMK